MTGSRYGILVGVTGAGDDLASLTWAADESKRRAVPITLVHAVGASFPPPPPSVLLTFEPVEEAARSLAADATRQLTALTGGVPPASTLVEPGRPGQVLSELSREAELVVVGHRDLHGVRKVLTHSTAVSLAGHARCPVVVVPAHWTSAHAGDHGWVTVGVHEAGAAPAVLRAAFLAAQRHGCGVRLVHAWRADGVYDDIVTSRVDPGWQHRVETEMRAGAQAVAAEHPSVKVDAQALHEWPADALLELSSGSDLLVVGRSGHLGGRATWLGSVARAVVHSAACPVMVVPA